MSKKDLDKLFQEKFKDFREIPDERVWESIEHSLDQRRKKRRVIPLWWKLGGVAAVLAIAILAINPFKSTVDTEDAVTDIENPVIPEQKNDTQENLPADLDEIINKNEAVVEEDNADRTESESAPDETVITTATSLVEKSDGIQKEQQIEENAIADVKETEIRKDGIDQRSVKEDEEVLAGVLSTNQTDQAEKLERANEANEVLRDNLKEDNAVQNAETAVAEQTEEKDEIEDDKGKKSIFEEIEKQQEEALVENSKGSKWSVGPSVAPVYFSSFGEGSPIHSSFTSNNKTGNVNLSYGVGVSYDISKKLKIRSGVHKVDYGYDTNDITFSSSLVASTSTMITNIDYTTTSRNLVVENSNRPEVAQEFSANDIVAESPSRNGRMVQEFGYVEVPMELNYALLDRKLNIDIIGGFSSLFLVNNTVTLESEGTSTEMGEANNLNDVNFSTNVGLGINYELSDRMKVHLEPMFKYQMNTFSATEGNFQPYSVGVYTGMSFKF